MKCLIIYLLLVVALTWKSKYPIMKLLLSSPESTNVLSPSGRSTGLAVNHNTNKGSKNSAFNYGAKWIWVKGSERPAHRFKATFNSFIYSDCPQSTARLYITADNKYNAYVNGKFVGRGSDWTKMNTFNIRLKCGKNSFKVYA